MPTAPISGAVARAADIRCLALAVVCASGLLAGCAGPQPNSPATVANATPSAPGKPLPPAGLREAVAALAGDLVAQAKLPPGRYLVTIDPWINARTGDQVETTRFMEAEIKALIPQHFPQLEPLPFTVETLDRKPFVLVGAIAPVTAPGSFDPALGTPGAYRIYGVIADLKTGKIAAAHSVWVAPDEVDVTPVAFFRDSPARVPDPSVAAYLSTSTARPGDPIDPLYLKNLRAEALIANATTAYDDGRYEQARALYHQAAALPEGGHQERVYNGLYLTNRMLGDQVRAAEAFARLVAYGLEHDHLGVKFLFRPGSTAFVPDPAISGAYPVWLRAIADRTAEAGACLRVIGHASPSGPAELNDRLSRARARRIAHDLVRLDPELRGRLETQGVGASDPIVGTGADNATDALDRRVDFQPVGCRQVRAAI
ncbi:MAG TPA: hypothetical protein VJ779_03735 [Acetobacteraceae bacterium]|nr:hypothetical protein [Acetobacteraceae bacterium]